MDNPLNVLLVEDLKIARLAFKSSVSSLNWQIDMAETGHDAITFCNKIHYDLVFMDIGLPDISGIDATKIIRETHPDLPIIALTAHFDDEIETAAMAAGMNAFLQKPFTLEKAQFCLGYIPKKSFL